MEHTIPYCVVFDWVASQPGASVATDEPVYQALRQGICHDVEVKDSYFAAPGDHLERIGFEMCTPREQDVLEDLEPANGFEPPTWHLSAQGPIMRMCNLLRPPLLSGWDQSTPNEPAFTGQSLPIRRAAMTLYKSLRDLYDKYTSKHPEKSQRQLLETPVVFFASGPPSSGKSLKFLSCYDFDLIKKALAAKVDDGSPSPPSPLESLSYEDFQGATADYNVDRLVESSFAMRLWKEFENEVNNSEKFNAVQGFMDMSQRLGNTRIPDMKQRITEWHDNPEGIAEERKQQLAQDFYWLLRKTWKIDDLNNAHLQRWSGIRRNIIYESTFANRSVDWIENYEIPKFKANGYATIVILLQVKLDELSRRLKMRAEATGQTPAPDAQVEEDLKDGQHNFLKSMDQIGWGVMMSHVEKGKGSETLLASFRPDQAHRDKSCIQKLAPAKTMDEWDLSNSSFLTEGLICEGVTPTALRQPVSGSCRDVVVPDADKQQSFN